MPLSTIIATVDDTRGVQRLVPGGQAASPLIDRPSWERVSAIRRPKIIGDQLRSAARVEEKCQPMATLAALERTLRLSRTPTTDHTKVRAFGFPCMTCRVRNETPHRLCPVKSSGEYW